MNFALILFVLLCISATLWCADHFVFRKRRVPNVPDPWWVEYGASFFPVILIVFVLRSFLAEPFKIPSGSMIPTLRIGDFILVNKYTYGIRLPVINKKIIELNSPQRGDVIVFRYPPDPSLDYIKRVIGLPGDTVSWLDKRLTINGKPIIAQRVEDYQDVDRLFFTPRFSEDLGTVKHDILIEEEAPAFVPYVLSFSAHENCRYVTNGLTCKVPEGHYFVMGDNRDNSQDSRVWGFVPDANLVGRAFFVWFNFDDLKRIGKFQ